MNSEWLFAESDRERLRMLIWDVADYCGVEIVTYTILSNHFHVLVIVPERAFIHAHEVLRRYRVLYPAPSRFRPERWDEIQQAVEAGTEEGLAWLEKQRRQMGDVSQYIKILKQRFTVLFNQIHKRHGTIWSERYKSVLVEDGDALTKMATYIDLNPVRAGLVTDPKDYRFCGYAEAVAGNVLARRGCLIVTRCVGWDQASADYRRRLFGVACKPRERGKTLDVAYLEQVIREKGMLPLSEILLCRNRYLTDGAVFGSAAFVKEQLEDQRRRYGRLIALEPKTLPPIADWGPLTVMRRPRRALCLNEQGVS